MPNVIRIPITNVYMDGDYTGQLLIGPRQQPINVILDTGSSAFAVDGNKYQPQAGDQTTSIAQTDSYGDQSYWTGAVIKTTVAAGVGSTQITLPGANVAIAYDASSDMFRSADGILGLAYAALDGAFQMPGDTWANKYPATQINEGGRTTIQPFLIQLSSQGVTSDKVSFYTLRSMIHAGGGDADDPLNKGWMILGGGEESTDLYTGAFQTVKVLADEWYNTNLKSIIVGGRSLSISARGPQGMPSNSIVDSGTNSLNLGKRLLQALFGLFSSSQRALLTTSVLDQRDVANSNVQRETWPDIKFVLQGDTADVSLIVSGTNYWQLDAGQAGVAAAGFTQGDDGLAILGLPLMNGYFTIFDGEADGGKGVIKFATRK